MPASETPGPQRALDWLFARQRFGVKLGLARMRALLAALDHPEGAFASVLVGGTNGKGSVTATLAAILHAAGRPVGRFTSPHLTHFRERFTLAGEPVEEALLLAALEDVRPHAERLGATFFEITTALACLLFARAGVEVAVMEVGLGGRFDATNALEPRLSVITGVALDHTEVLGETVAEIASEKAGILRPGRLALTGATGEALGVIAREAERLGAPLWRLGREISVTARDDSWRGSSLTVRTPEGAPLAVHTPLLGAHQVPNTALAVAAARALGVPDAATVRGAAAVRWPGRLEPIPYEGRTFLLDGAHNPAAAAALADTLARLGAAPALLVFGTSADKDAAGMVRALAESTRAVITTRARLSPRSSPPEALAELWRGAARRVHVAEAPEAALAEALAWSRPGETVVVAGSLYLLGEVRPLLLGEADEGRERLQ
jgi:dihydrofolate synthase/folylpolyglutamate synthase